MRSQPWRTPSVHCLYSRRFIDLQLVCRIWYPSSVSIAFSRECYTAPGFQLHAFLLPPGHGSFDGIRSNWPQQSHPSTTPSDYLHWYTAAVRPWSAQRKVTFTSSTRSSLLDDKHNLTPPELVYNSTTNASNLGGSIRAESLAWFCLLDSSFHTKTMTPSSVLRQQPLRDMCLHSFAGGGWRTCSLDHVKGHRNLPAHQPRMKPSPERVLVFSVSPVFTGAFVFVCSLSFSTPRTAGRANIELPLFT